MKVNVRSILKTKDSSPLEFSGELDLSSVIFWGQQPFQAPVKIVGVITHFHLDTFNLTYTITYQRVLNCARCLTETKTEQTEQYTHILLEVYDKESFSENMFIPVLHGVLEVEQAVVSDILLTLDDVTLCSPDCKGICSICGGDRNKADCDCSVSFPDPRFDKLRELLDKSST